MEVALFDMVALQIYYSVLCYLLPYASTNGAALLWGSRLALFNTTSRTKMAKIKSDADKNRCAFS